MGHGLAGREVIAAEQNAVLSTGEKGVSECQVAAQRAGTASRGQIAIQILIAVQQPIQRAAGNDVPFWIST